MLRGSVLCLYPVLILFALIHTGTSYRCYVCAGMDKKLPFHLQPPLPDHVQFTEACVDAKNVNALNTTECTGPRHMCVTCVTTFGEAKLVMRDCTDPNQCNKIKDVLKTHECNTDLCNSATNTVPSLIFISVISLIFTKVLL